MNDILFPYKLTSRTRPRGGTFGCHAWMRVQCCVEYVVYFLSLLYLHSHAFISMSKEEFQYITKLSLEIVSNKDKKTTPSMLLLYFDTTLSWGWVQCQWTPSCRKSHAVVYTLRATYHGLQNENVNNKTIIDILSRQRNSRIRLGYWTYGLFMGEDNTMLKWLYFSDLLAMHVYRLQIMIESKKKRHGYPRHRFGRNGCMTLSSDLT